MSYYSALPHTEQEADRISESSSIHGDDVGKPHDIVITTSDPHVSASSPVGSHKLNEFPTDVLQKGNGFQQVPLEFENLGGSQHLKAAKEESPSKLATIVGSSPSGSDSVLTSVLHKLRKPSSENMYDLVENDDYAVVDLPQDQRDSPAAEDEKKVTKPETPTEADARPIGHTSSPNIAVEQHETTRDSDKKTDLTVENLRSQNASEESAREQSLPQQLTNTSAARPEKRAPIAITIPPPVQSTAFSNHESEIHRFTPTASVVPETPISAHSTVDIASPRPDLQSIQGAYVGNVARLERSVEHLSESPDIDSEIRRMRREMEDRASSNGSASVKKVTNDIGSPMSRSIVASPERVSNHGSPHVSRAIHSRSHSSSHSATSRLPQTLNEIREPDEDNQSHGPDLPIPPDINDAASFTRSAMPPPMTPSPPLQPMLNVHVTTPSTVHGDNHTNANIAEDMELHRLDFVPYSYENPHSTYYQPDMYMPTYQPPVTEELFYQRPASAASGDTYQQAKIAFKDFDGVHVAMHPRPSASIHRYSIGGNSINESGAQPTTAIGPDGRPQNIEGLVYYPAPVPRVLNMPKKLSKFKPDFLQQKRRNQVLAETLGGAAAISEAGGSSAVRASGGKQKDPLAKLPPALRAAAFFDGPLPGMDDFVLAPQNGSAVQTMDAVLDAAATAPTSMLVGGGATPAPPPLMFDTSETDKTKKKRSFFKRSKGKQKATEENDEDNSGDERPGTGDRMLPFHRQSTYEADKAMLAPDRDEEPSDEEFGSEGQLDSEDDEFHGAPATLLAELELRKKAQKKRTKGKEIRTRMRSGVGGLGSTLLELDTVAQLQHDARRKQKRITLAWEDREAAAEGAASENDDDVPLAVLLQNKNAKEEKTVDGLQKQIEEFKPTGLMAQLDQEENEPLIQRRARLRGEVYLNPHSRGSYVPSQQDLIDEDDDDDDEIEGETLAQRAARLRREETETLAQRMARLKKEKEDSALQDEGLSSDFAKDLLNLFDESKVNAEDQDEPSEHASHDEEDDKKQRRTSRYRITGNGSMDKHQSRVVPRPPPQPQPQLHQDEPEHEDEKEEEEEEETLAQRKIRLLRESQVAPALVEPNSNEPASVPVTQQQAEGSKKARLSMADIMAAHPQHRPFSLIQLDQPSMNPNRNSQANPYMNAGQQVASAIGAPLCATSGPYIQDQQHKSTHELGERPGTLLADLSKRKSALDLNALNTTANEAAKQNGGWQDAPFDFRQSTLPDLNHARATTMTSYQGPGLHQRQSVLNPIQNVDNDRASTMVGAPYMMPDTQNATSRMTFQGMPLYAHYHAQQQQGGQRAPNAINKPTAGEGQPTSLALQRNQPYRMSYLPGAPGQPNMYGTPPATTASANPHLAPPNQLAQPGGYDSGFMHGYQAGLEQALRMTSMMGAFQPQAESEGVQQQWRPSVAF